MIGQVTATFCLERPRRFRPDGRRWRLGVAPVLALALLLLPHDLDAQEVTKIVRIGVLSPGYAGPSPFMDALRDQLRQLGHVEGRNITYEFRYAEGRYDRLPGLAAELVRLNVDVIVARATPATLAAKHATTSIPIVMPVVADAVEAGLVASLGRPGGNVTGVSVVARELSGKRLQLLKEVAPKASRVAVLWNPDNPAAHILLRETGSVARSLGLTLHPLPARAPGDLPGAFSELNHTGADALFVLDDPLLIDDRARIVDFAKKSRLPTMYGLKQFVEAGGLMSYGADIIASYRQAAVLVDKILRGAKPADLPVEQPTKFELVINLKAAKALGLTIPQSLLVRADEVIR